MVMLWRAAPADGAHFGMGSYWTASELFARRFRLWLDETADGRHVIYRADVDLSASLDLPFGVEVSSPVITRHAAEFAAAGYRWVTFYEGVFEGATSRQYVYLGTDPIAAEPA
jgi:hypothetical protein